RLTVRGCAQQHHLDWTQPTVQIVGAGRTNAGGGHSGRNPGRDGRRYVLGDREVNVDIIVLAGVTLMLTIVVVGQSLELRKAQHALAGHKGEHKPLQVTEPATAELESKLKQAYEAQITSAAQTFGTDMVATSKKLSEQVSRLTTTVIEEELEAYQK